MAYRTKTLIIAPLLSLLPTAALAQKVTGTTAFEDSVEIPFKVTILEGKGAARTVSTKAFTQPTFELATPKAGDYLVRITAQGYRPYEVELKTKKGETFDLGQVVLGLISDSLGTATVTYKRPLVTNDGAKMTINVKGTYLGRTGKVTDMLAKAPGFIKTMNGVEVFRYGKPVFELDGRIVSESTVLKMMQASEIDKIEIDKQPGAQYPIGTKVVVRLKRNYDMKDNIFLEVSNDVGTKQRVSESPTVNFKIKKGRFTARTNADWHMSGNLNQETYTTEIYHNDYTYRSVETAKIPSYNRGANLLQAFDWMPNDSAQINVTYSFSHNHNRVRTVGDMTVNDKNNESYVRSRSSLNNSYSNNHNISFYYVQLFRKRGQALQITADYANNRAHSSYSSWEQKDNDPANTVRSPRYNRYDVFSGKTKYWITLPWNIRTIAGADYDYVHTPFRQSVFNNEALIGTSENLTHDHNVAAFAQLYKKISPIVIQLSARYEYEYTRIWDRGKLNTFHDSQLTPFLTVMFYKSEKVPSVRFDYVRRANRVNYKNLVATPIYRDSLYYEKGDASLLPMLYNNFSLSVGWKGFSLSASYRKYKNYISSTTFNLDKSTNIITYMPFNLPRYSSWSTDLSYSKRWGKFNMYLSAGLTQGHSHIEFQEKTELINKLQWNASTNLNFDFNDNWSAYASFSYESRSRDMMTFLRSRNSLNLGISGTLLKDKLSISLDANDLLRGQNYNRITDRLLNVMSKTDGYNDFRGVSLSLSYTIFSKPINVRSSHNNSDILQRTN